MDKKVVLAVAGSGKTESIVGQLNLTQRALLLTYTTNTFYDLERRIIAKFGYFPENVTVSTYFSFLNSFCYRPLLYSEVRDRGISFEKPGRYADKFPLTSIGRFLDGGRRLYHCRLAKLLEVRACLPVLCARIGRYYDKVYVDEVQDFGGHDFNFLMQISQAPVDWHLTGDFFQHTFSTSHDGNVNKALHDDMLKYQKRLTDAGFLIDTTSLAKCHRCSKDVCNFINDEIGVAIVPASERKSELVILDCQAEADRIHADTKILKLFYKQHEQYDCYSMNWGSSKGLDHHQDVCVVMYDKAWDLYKKGKLREMSPSARNKLYVACSRPRRNLYLVPQNLLKGT